MRRVEGLDEVRSAVNDARARGHQIGFVPTMGALHEGHASLMRAARGETGFVVVSVFVNPTQFGPNEDFHRYPRPIEHDLAVCAAEGVDLVFTPTVETMYPPGFRTFVTVEGLDAVLCGATRPGHFRGVATVVAKLFHQVRPDRAYFGQKDAQQVRVLRRMVRDLDIPVEIRVCPIVREPDGLAMSSRNRYLDPDQRRQAVVLVESLDEARRRVEAGERDPATVRNLILNKLATAPAARVDYVALVDPETLAPVDVIGDNLLIALAVFVGTTRLIDNVELNIG